MYCNKCGAQIQDGSRHCNMCGAVIADRVEVQVVASAETVPNYLVGSILVTLFCCLPFGVIGIIYAAQANSKLACGDLPGALAAARTAKTFTWWGFILGLLGAFGWGIFSLTPVMWAALAQ